MSLNVFSQIAMIMLIGIAAKNGVLIVEFANQLRDQGLERAGAEQREPIGVVVFFGTTMAVLLTLIVVPAVYTLLAGGHRSPQYLAGRIEQLRRSAPAQVSSRSDPT